MPVASLFEFLLDHVSNQKNLASTEKVGNNKGRQRRYEDHSDTTDNSRNAQRKDDLCKCLKFIGSKISSCVNDIFINLCQYIINRKHHKRQEVIYHT